MSPLIHGLAKWIYDDVDGTIYQENGSHHISCTYFMDVQILRQTANSLALVVEKMRVASLVCVDQGWDHAIQAIITGLAMRLEKPFNIIMEGEVEAPNLNIGSNLSNCSVIVSYTSHKEQVTELLDIVKRLGGSPVQVISIIDEKSEAQSACKANRIDFYNLFSTNDIIKELKELPNTEAATIGQITELLNS